MIFLKGDATAPAGPGAKVIVQEELVAAGVAVTVYDFE